jgi:uncharacterized protein (TIGR00725 family)
VTGTRYVAVVGSGTATAERDGIVVCGGFSGVMEAAARGATEVGGTAIGILPDEDRERQNEYLTYSVATGVGQARNLAVVCSGDVVIAVGGEYGTLSEIGLARKAGRPVVVLDGWDLGEHVSLASSPREAVDAAFAG